MTPPCCEEIFLIRENCFIVEFNLSLVSSMVALMLAGIVQSLVVCSFLSEDAKIYDVDEVSRFLSMPL